MSGRERLIDLLLGLLPEDEERELLRELEDSPELQAELNELREAFYTLPEAGRIEPAPEGVWDRIRASRDEEAGGAAPPIVALQRRTRRTRPWLAVAAAVVLTAGASLAWGGWQRSRAVRLDREQASLAYWMLHPEISIVQLEPPPGEDPSGIVCLLPEGRTLLLQTHPPEGRGRYRLWGSSDGERTLIGETDGRMLIFDRGGFDRVEVELSTRRGATVVPLGGVALESEYQHNYD